jgi:hypothetical protein
MSWLVVHLGEGKQYRVPGTDILVEYRGLRRGQAGFAINLNADGDDKEKPATIRCVGEAAVYRPGK